MNKERISKLRIGGRYKGSLWVELEKPGINFEYGGKRFDQGQVAIRNRKDFYRICPSAKKYASLKVGQVFHYKVQELEDLIMERIKDDKIKVAEAVNSGGPREAFPEPSDLSGSIGLKEEVLGPGDLEELTDGDSFDLKPEDEQNIRAFDMD